MMRAKALTKYYRSTLALDRLSLGIPEGAVYASRANRTSTYPLVARLHRRAELLAALAHLIGTANLLAGRLDLEFPSALWILPTWLPVWLLAATLALPLSGLVERSGSHLIGYALLAGLLIANDRKTFLIRHGMNWPSPIVGGILWPANTLLEQASAGTHGRDYGLAWALTCTYAILLFALAASLFKGKDLLWSE